MSSNVKTPLDGTLDCGRFANVPANYYRNATLTPQQRCRHRAVLGLLRGLSGRVLDYGCGYGELTYAMSTTNQVHGVDVDPQRIAFAKSEFAPLSFSVCHSGGVDFSDAAFDVVTSVVVLPFVPDPHAYIAEIRRVLKPGGYLIVVGKTGPALDNLYRRLRGLPAREYGQPMPSGQRYWIPPRSRLERLLIEHGFIVLKRGGFNGTSVMSRTGMRDVINGIFESCADYLHLTEFAPYPTLLAQRDPSS